MTKNLITITSMAILLIMAGGLASCANRDDDANCVIDERLVRIDGSYYITEGRVNHYILQSMIRVRPKSGIELGEEFDLLPPFFNQTGESGIVYLRVPEGINFLRYFCMLQRTNKFELVELVAAGYIGGGTEVAITGKVWYRSMFPCRPGSACQLVFMRTIVNDTGVFVPLKNGVTWRGHNLLAGFPQGDIITIRGKYYEGFECQSGEEFYFLEIIEIID